MSKKLTKLQERYKTEIFTELCERIGIDPKEVDFQKTDWQEEYVWTIEEEIAYQKWLLAYLKSRPKAVEMLYTFQFINPADARNLEILVKHFTLFYGWAFREEDDLDDIVEKNQLETKNLHKLISENKPNIN